VDDQVLSHTDVVQREIAPPPVPEVAEGEPRRPQDLVFARLLERLREERGLTKADLAKRSGFDPSSITRFEQGARDPERETVLTLADAMVLPLADRDRLLAAAGYRSELWDDPLLLELSQVLAERSLPPSARNDVRTVVRMAIDYCRLQRLERF